VVVELPCSYPLTGCRIGTLKVIFQLPEKAFGDWGILTRTSWPRTHFAYVEWFSQPLRITTAHGLPSISKSRDIKGQPMGAVVPLSDIRQTCMLTPDFTARSTLEKLEAWGKNPTLVQKECEKFLVNPYQSLYSFQTVYV
jgi:hypothetical protein